MVILVWLKFETLYNHYLFFSPFARRLARILPHPISKLNTGKDLPCSLAVGNSILKFFLHHTHNAKINILRDRSHKLIPNTTADSKYSPTTFCYCFSKSFFCVTRLTMYTLPQLTLGIFKKIF